MKGLLSSSGEPLATETIHAQDTASEYDNVVLCKAGGITSLIELAGKGNTHHVEIIRTGVEVMQDTEEHATLIIQHTVKLLSSSYAAP